MKTSKILAAAALSLLAATGAQAQLAYDGEGVLPAVSANSRATVAAEAVRAVRSPDPFSVAASSSVMRPPAQPADRATVRAQAVAAAHAPNQNLAPDSFYNSVIPAQYTQGSLKFRGNSATM